LNILLLGDIEATRGRKNLNPNEVAKTSRRVSHVKPLTETGLHKGNVFRVVTWDHYVIYIEQKESVTTRIYVDEDRWIIFARGKASGSHNRGKVLKPGARDLLKAI
jgi:hypothetical protein